MLQFNTVKFETFLSEHNIAGAEYDKAEVSGFEKRGHFLRIGNKIPNYEKSIHMQVKAGIYSVPRVSKLNGLQRHLKRAVRNLDDDDSSSDSESGSGSASESEEETEQKKPSTNTSNYPLLRKLGVELDLSIPNNYTYVMKLVGECFALQSAYDNQGKKEDKIKLCTNQYHQLEQSKVTYVISLSPPPRKDKSFERHLRRKPYFKELLEVMNIRNSCQQTVGQRRLLKYLARTHEDAYLQIGQERGLSLTRVMDEVESAAMWRDARLLDSQSRIVLKHLRCFFEPHKITVPLSRIYSLVEGYTKPRVKVFEYHVDGSKFPEIVHAQYQNISKEFVRAVEELIEENTILSNSITRIFLVVGGDHGKGAFRVVFRALLSIQGRREPVYKTKAIAEVYCKKEEGVLLDESVIPWLEADLQTLINSHLVAMSTKDKKKIACILHPKPVDSAEPASPVPSMGLPTDRHLPADTPASNDPDRPVGSVRLPEPILLQSSDLAFTAYTLGKEGSASHSCPYCKLTKNEWTISPDERPPGEPWTTESLEEMYYDSSKKGAKKLGVKSFPKLHSIGVKGIVLAVTHLGLGVDNGTIAAFEDKVEATIIDVPEEDAARRRRLEEIARQIPETRLAINEFDETPDGKLLDRLKQQQRDAGKVMSEQERSLLTVLHAQQLALTTTVSVAKKNDDIPALEAAQRALKDFTNGKEGGKKRKNLMAKFRKSGRQLTPDQQADLERLRPTREELEKKRDRLLREQTKIKDTLKENTQIRRKDDKFWYIPMDRLYRKYGVERENYHMRKFSGRPLQQIKKEAESIFNDAKALLKEFKQPGVSDDTIDILCDEVTQILTASYAFFRALLKTEPTEDDIRDATEKKNKLMSLFRKTGLLGGNITVKGHIIDDHAINWMRKCKDLGVPLRLIIEQFVELNHQIGSRIDEQTKRIVSADTMANKHCKRKALDTHDLVSKRIKFVHEKASRGEYKKKEKPAQTISERVTANSPVPSTRRHSVTPSTEPKTMRASTGARIIIREIENYRKGANIDKVRSNVASAVANPVADTPTVPDLSVEEGKATVNGPEGEM